MMSEAIEALLKRDRTLVIGFLAAVIIVSWAYVLAGAGMGMSAFDMSSLSMALGQASEPSSMQMGGDMAQGMGGAMGHMAMPVQWSAGYAVLMFFMWWVMMIAMMLPSASPTILLYGTVNRKAEERPDHSARPWSSLLFLSLIHI